MSGMTDAEAIGIVFAAISNEAYEKTQPALHHIAARLRGEAQAEQQGDIPFLWFATDDDGRCGIGADRATAVSDLGGVPEAVSRVFPLYTRPQPTAVAGDESAAFDAWFRGEQGTAYDGMWSFARAAWMHRAALSSTAAPAIGDPINADSDADYLRKLGDRIGGDCGAVLHTIAVGLDAPAPVAGDAVERAAAAIFECDSGQPWSAATTREREIMTRFARAALAQDRASKSAPVDTSTNEAWIARAESKLAAGVDVSEAAIFRAADALCGKWNLYYPWNLHYPDAVSMAKTALTAAALRTGGGAA